MSKATVFVSHLPHRKNPKTQDFEPAYRIDAAYQYGDVRMVIPPHTPYNNQTEILPTLRKELAAYDFLRGDSLLLLGDSVINATVSAIVSQKGNFRVLRWDRLAERYYPIIVSV